MNEEIMPNVCPATFGNRTLLIDNLKEDRHYDTLDWTEAEDGSLTMVLSEQQAIYLHRRLGEWLSSL